MRFLPHLLRTVLLGAFASSMTSATVFRADTAFERLEAVPVQYAALESADFPAARSRLSRFSASPVAPPTNQLFRSPHGIKISSSKEEEPACDFYPEIVLVQDVSSSFEDDVANVNKFLPELFDTLTERFQGKVKFGMTTFVDKFVEVRDWGSNANDYCVAVEIPLAPVDDELLERLQSRIPRIVIGGGGDYLDGANEAMLRTALSDSVGWSTGTHDPETGRPIVRILIVATDAGIHEAGYAQELSLAAGRLSAPLPANDIIHRPSAIHERINAECRTMDFPTGEDLRSALQSRDIIPIIFAGSPSWIGSDGTANLWAQYRKEVLQRFGQTNGPWADVRTGLAEFYGSYFSHQLSMDAVVQVLSESSSNLLEIVTAALNDVEGLTCIQLTTTTTAGPDPSEPQPPFDDVTTPQPLHSTEATAEEASAEETTSSTTSRSTTTSTTANSSSSSEESTEGSTALSFTTVTIPNVTEPLPVITTEGTTDTTFTTVTEPIVTDGPFPVITTEETTTSSSSSSSTPTSGSSEEAPFPPFPHSTPAAPETERSTEGGQGEITEGGGNGGHTVIPEEDEEEEEKKGGAGVIIGAASGGAAVAAAAGLLVAKKMGLLFNGAAESDLNVTQDVDNVENTQDREQFEAVTGDLFA